MPACDGTRLTIPLPDDFHHHARDGAKTAAILKHATQRFRRCLFMPNLKPPLTTTARSLEYKQHIEASMPTENAELFQPLYVLYLTDTTTANEIHAAHAAGVTGCKYYPAGATTNSDAGVTNIQKCHEALQTLQDHDMMLCIHSEVTHGDIFDREATFLEEIVRPLVKDFPQLKITLEHISTQTAVDYVLQEAPATVCASITAHHLLLNRNGRFVGAVLRVILTID